VIVWWLEKSLEKKGPPFRSSYKSCDIQFQRFFRPNLLFGKKLIGVLGARFTFFDGFQITIGLLDFGG